MQSFVKNNETNFLSNEKYNSLDCYVNDIIKKNKKYKKSLDDENTY
jgi:hypothetical protein